VIFEFKSRYTYMKDSFDDESWIKIINESNTKAPVFLLSYGSLSDVVQSVHISWYLLFSDSTLVNGNHSIKIH
jgi:hypothetical protein